MLYTIISSIGRGCAAFSQKASESAGRESIRPAQAIAPALSHFALQPFSSTRVTQPVEEPQFTCGDARVAGN